ncbi:MAG: cupredoxin domain-containing protein, partial [Deltaproteobacteria bacterium]|nr:cupredoxin domain-containing protein [Deltaproteobacteria bacterium]
EEGRFFFTLTETGLPGESTLGVLGLHQIDTVTGALAPTALAKIQGSGATIFLADRTGMGAREAGVVADATPIPDATSGGSQPPYVNPPEPPPPPPASGLTLSSVNFAAGAQHLVMMPNTEQKSMVATLPDGSFPAVQVTSAPAQAVKLTINCDKTIGSGAQVANWSGSAPFALTPNPTAKQDLLIKYTYTGDAPAGGTLGKCTAIATGADGTTSNEVAILFKIGELPKPIVAGGAPGLKPNNFIKGYVCQYSAEKAVACATKAQNFAGIYKPQIVVSTAEGETATLEIVSCSSAGWSFDKAGSGVKLLGKAVGLPSPAFVHELDIRYIPKGAAAGTAESCDLKATSSAGKAATLTVPLEWHVVPTQLPSSPVIDQATAPSIMGLPPTYGLVEKGATVTIEGITITAVGGIKDVAVECDHAELRPTVKKAAENKYTLGVKVGTSDTTCSLTATSNGNASKTAQIVIQVKSQASGGAIGTSTLKIVPFKGGTSAFSPKELTIPVGSKGNLMITNEDTIDHTFTTEPPHVDVRVYKGTSVLVTIPTDKAGEIPFHCGIHPTMKGKIIIK